MPFEKKMIKKATPFNYSRNCSLITCSAEDLIVLKAFADRLQDWLDIEGIVMRQQKKINTKYIFRQLKPLCEVKESPEIINKLRKTINSNIK